MTPETSGSGACHSCLTGFQYHRLPSRRQDLTGYPVLTGKQMQSPSRSNQIRTQIIAINPILAGLFLNTWQTMK